MTNAGLSGDTIVLKIETSQSEFDTSPDALAVLKAAGVTDRAIDAMIKAPARIKRTATAAASSSSSTPATQTAESQVLVDPQAKAMVYLYRQGKLWGKALEPSVFIDEQKLLDMDNGRYIALKLAPGRHVLRSNDKNSGIDQTWEPGKTYYVRINIVTGMLKGHGQIGLVGERVAMADMVKLRPLNRDNVEPSLLDLVDFMPVK